MKRLHCTLGLVLVACGLHVPCFAGSATGSLLWAGIKKARIGICIGNEREPSLVIRIAELRQDFETKGFFRIGVLPLEVATGVDFEFRDSSTFSNCLDECQQYLSSQGTRHLELRAVQFILPGPPTNTLTAGRARLTLDGCLQLMDGVSFNCRTNRLDAPSGVLQLKGSCPGQLILDGTPRRILDLTACASRVAKPEVAAAGRSSPAQATKLHVIP